MLNVNHRVALAQLGQRGDHHIDVRGFIGASVAAARAGGAGVQLVFGDQAQIRKIG